jgi:hypothetical protein
LLVTEQGEASAVHEKHRAMGSEGPLVAPFFDASSSSSASFDAALSAFAFLDIDIDDDCEVDSGLPSEAPPGGRSWPTCTPRLERLHQRANMLDVPAHHHRRPLLKQHRRMARPRVQMAVAHHQPPPPRHLGLGRGLRSSGVRHCRAAGSDFAPMASPCRALPRRAATRPRPGRRPKGRDEPEWVRRVATMRRPPHAVARPLTLSTWARRHVLEADGTCLSSWVRANMPDPRLTLPTVDEGHDVDPVGDDDLSVVE